MTHMRSVIWIVQLYYHTKIRGIETISKGKFAKKEFSEKLQSQIKTRYKGDIRIPSECR